MAALPLQDNISQTSTRTGKYRIFKAQFGNGYEQRIKDGINNKVRFVTIVWGNIDEADMQTIETAFDTAEGVDAFQWTPFGESVEYDFISPDGLVITPHSGDIYTVTTELEQVYE